MLGQTFEPRRMTNDMTEFPTKLRNTPLGNRLTDGTLIDICGVVLLYQDPITMSRVNQLQPQEVIENLNSLKPQCPVLCTDIKFTYVDSRERERKAHQKASDDDCGSAAPMSMRYGPVHVPLVDLEDVTEESRSYVFPACGHVHGYHKSLEGKPCPLCRKLGSFVPIAFEFEPAICDQVPTHVFNPCGHVASLRTCSFWAKKKVLTRNLLPFHDLNAICPFCGNELSKDRPFSRLILQTESGRSWSDEDRAEDLDIDSSSNGSSMKIVSGNRSLDKAVVEDEPSDLFDQNVEDLLAAQRLLFERAKNQYRNIENNEQPPTQFLTPQKDIFQAKALAFHVARACAYPTYAPHIKRYD